METEDTKRGRWEALLAEGKGLEALQYAAQEKLIGSDEDVERALHIINDAIDRIVAKQDVLQARYDAMSEEKKKRNVDEIEGEFNRLQEERDPLDKDFNAIMKWRAGE